MIDLCNITGVQTSAVLIEHSMLKSLQTCFAVTKTCVIIIKYIMYEAFQSVFVDGLHQYHLNPASGGNPFKLVFKMRCIDSYPFHVK